MPIRSCGGATLERAHVQLFGTAPAAPTTWSTPPFVLGPAEQFTCEAQGFFLSLSVLRFFGNGALERFDQLGDSREYRTVVGGERGVTILQPAFDSFSGMQWVLSSCAKTAPARIWGKAEIRPTKGSAPAWRGIMDSVLTSPPCPIGSRLRPTRAE
jgi:hypothetical protein